jgi:hypothetical protein
MWALTLATSAQIKALPGTPQAKVDFPLQSQICEMAGARIELATPRFSVGGVY